MQLKPFTKQNILSVVTSLILFASVPVVLAWTSPSSTPPSGNVAAPVNVGLDYQIKQGKLGLYGGDVALRVSRDGSYTPDSVSLLPTLLLGVNGKVGAAQYCDEKGMNCISLRNINSQVINNNNNSTTTCQQGFKVSPFYYSASNDQQYTKNITLPAGTWKITGNGTIGPFGGTPGAYIWVSKDGAFGTSKNVLYQLVVTTKYSGTTATPVYSKTWTIPADKGTFTLTRPETLRISVAQGTLAGTIIFQGPEEFACGTAGNL